ncbi:alpha/beta hydrolase [Rhizobium sp. P38BS-XIX]|uniref:alpha/beta hydrolase n=1 Tax=Rhizobium sp. P38BS-XIX TaxID=2726740 RepID=UPI0014569195|nr:alpha/beta hydrolase [Rhizobium sp. P38BS-XIX]NLS00108.1 alpha/beta hydrolase [Rhizobium sp. P38BS-XIX]
MLDQPGIAAAMTEADLFKIRAHVPDFDLISDEYRRESGVARSRWVSRLDVAYGSRPEERLDLFFPDERDQRRPIHIFVHGGYWRANVKEDYAFIANTVCAAGSIAAIVEYGKLPAVRLATLVKQVRRASLWLKLNAACLGANPEAISASGHSAGAHLAFYLAGNGPHETAALSAPPSSLFLTSGIYDLRPITTSFLQGEISLSEKEVSQWSPLGATLQSTTHIELAVGGMETAPFLEQAETFAISTSTSRPIHLIPGADHMSIARDMGDTRTAMGARFWTFLELAARATSRS